MRLPECVDVPNTIGRIILCRLTPHKKKPPQPKGEEAQRGAGLNANQRFDFLGEPLSSHVQTALDRSHGRVELIAHLDQ